MTKVHWCQSAFIRWLVSIPIISQNSTKTVSSWKPEQFEPAGLANSKWIVSQYNIIMVELYLIGHANHGTYNCIGMNCLMTNL